VAAPDVFSFGTLALSMVLIGGVGTIVGPIIAAIALIFATEALAGIGGWKRCVSSSSPSA